MEPPVFIDCPTEVIAVEPYASTGLAQLNITDNSGADQVCNILYY